MRHKKRVTSFRASAARRRWAVVLALSWTLLTVAVAVAALGGAVLLAGVVLSSSSVSRRADDEVGDGRTRRRAVRTADPRQPKPCPLSWQEKEQRLARALEQGTQTSVRFSAADLNAMIERSKQRGEFMGEATITMEDSLIVADVRLLISGAPGIREETLNGRIILDCALEESASRLYIMRIELDEATWTTGIFLRNLQGRNLYALAKQAPLLEELRRNFRRIVVDEDALVVVTRAESE